jgi:hypothetical protein
MSDTISSSSGSRGLNSVTVKTDRKDARGVVKVIGLGWKWDGARPHNLIRSTSSCVSRSFVRS